MDPDDGELLHRARHDHQGRPQQLSAHLQEHELQQLQRGEQAETAIRGARRLVQLAEEDPQQPRAYRATALRQSQQPGEAPLIFPADEEWGEQAIHTWVVHMWRAHQARERLPGTAGGEQRQQATPHEARGDRQPERGETHPNRDPQQQPHHTAPTPPHRHTPAEVTTATTPDGTGPLARPQTQSGRDRKPAEAQTAQSSPDTATGPQTESTQQEEAVASRVKQQPTRERLTGDRWRTLPGHGHGAAKGRRRQTSSSEATEGGAPPNNQTKPGGTEEQRKPSHSTRPQPKQPLGRPCHPANGSNLRCPKGPRRSRRATRKRAGPARTLQTTTRWSRHTPPDQSGGMRQTHQTRGAHGKGRAVRRSLRKRTAEREEDMQTPAPTARQARRKRTWAARCRGLRRRGAGSSTDPPAATRQGTQGGQERRRAQPLEEGTSPDGGTDAKPNRGDPGSLRPGLRGSELRSVRERSQSGGGGALWGLKQPREQPQQQSTYKKQCSWRAA